MSSDEYYASEFSDDYLDAQADDFLEKSGFYFRLDPAEVSALVLEGARLLLVDSIPGKNNKT